MNRCPACGKVYGEEARFCTRDGSKLIALPTTPAARGTVAGRAERPVELTHANLTDRVLDGRYRIVRKVGEGGMSFVYLASDIATQEQYAIKVLSAALSSDENAMARLRREASLGMRLAHPNVCHIIRLGETQDGLVYVVMPYVEGEVLSDRNNRLGTLPIAEVVRHVRDIAAGLHVAHELKIVHRDLKPENVMICKQPGGGGARGGDGFRARQGAPRRRGAAEAHGDRDHPGHAGVHESRAASRPAARSAHGRVFARADDVRDAHRRSSRSAVGRSRR